MKKVLLGLLAFCLITLLLIYTLIPSQIKINKTIIVNASLASVSRNILYGNGWNNWFSQRKEKITNLYFFTHNNIHFSNIKFVTATNATILIETNNIISNADISITPIKSDSILVNWSCIVDASKNPFKRINNYFNAIKIKKTMDEIANNFKVYIEDLKSIYGFNVRTTTLKDSSMIALKATINNYPTVSDIYAKIEILEHYANVNNASPTNFPMLNIQKIDSLHYNFMVALPVNKRLENSGEILYKQMLPNGNFLCSDSLNGGFKKLDILFTQFENYRRDLNLLSPAIPFQSLITDRRKEADTTKWITKFYYPIF